MPRKGGHGNECTQDEIEPLYKQLITPVRYGKRKRDDAESAKSTPSKETPAKKRMTYSDEFKLDCANQYAVWVKAGSPRGFGPGKTLNEEYGCTREFPKECYDRMLAGKLTDQRKVKSGRKLKFDEETTKEMQAVIRAQRDKKRAAPAQLIRCEMNKTNSEREPAEKKQVPSTRTIKRAKAALEVELVSLVAAIQALLAVL